MDERAIELLVALLADQVPQAPGSEASTLRALRALEPLPPDARIADLGCGRGASAAVLARRGHVLGVDLLPEMVAATRARGVDAVVGDIAAPPIAPGTLDLVWSEGAAYAIGFAEALRLWRPLLKPGGGIGVTELCSLSDDVPDFWKQAYPAMRTADACRQVFVDGGYTLLDSFLLPRADWAAYYEPVAARLPAFRARHAGDVVAQAVADELQAEIASWRESGDTFGYLFLVGRT